MITMRHWEALQSSVFKVSPLSLYVPVQAQAKYEKEGISTFPIPLSLCLFPFSLAFTMSEDDEDVSQSAAEHGRHMALLQSYLKWKHREK